MFLWYCKMKGIDWTASVLSYQCWHLSYLAVITTPFNHKQEKATWCLSDSMVVLV